MKEHSFFSDLSDDDLVEFTEDTLIKIGKLKKAFKQVFIGQIEIFVKTTLNSQGVKTFSATKMYKPNGQQIIHENNWFSNGMACRLLKLGNPSWKQGLIKIRVEIKFITHEEKTTNTDFSEVIEVNVNDITNMTNLLNDVNNVDDEIEILRRQLDSL